MSEERPLPQDRQFWFSAKRYGFGWGFPTRWQGWLVLLIYVVLLVGGGFLCFSLTRPILWFCVLAAVLTICLFAVFRLKGPPPRWRWGNEM